MIRLLFIISSSNLTLWNGSKGNRYQFTGHEFDEETGFDYYGARYYNRELGRYMNVDPLSEKYYAWSSYNYTMGNPVNYTDPTGKGVDTDFVNTDTGEHKHVDDGKDEVALVDSYGWVWIPSYESIVESRELDVVETLYFKKKFDAEIHQGGVIIQRRVSEGEDWTISELQAVGNGQSVTGYILEPGGPSTATANQDKRIPEGVYNIEDYSSAKHPDNFLLYNSDVSKSRKILYHSGNNGAQTEGCHLPGTSADMTNGTVSNSVKKMDEIREFIQSFGSKNVKTVITNNIN